MRVRDYREHMISAPAECGGVSRQRRDGGAGIVDFGADHLVLATGSYLAAGRHRHGAGRSRAHFPDALTPDDVFKRQSL